MGENRYHKTVNGISVDVDAIESITIPMLEMRHWSYLICFKSGHHTISSDAEGELVDMCHKELTEKFISRLNEKDKISTAGTGELAKEKDPAERAVMEVVSKMQKIPRANIGTLISRNQESRLTTFTVNEGGVQCKFSEVKEGVYVLIIYNYGKENVYAISKEQFEQLVKAFHG